MDTFIFGSGIGPPGLCLISCLSSVQKYSNFQVVIVFLVYHTPLCKICALSSFTQMEANQDVAAASSATVGTAANTIIVTTTSNVDTVLTLMAIVAITIKVSVPLIIFPRCAALTEEAQGDESIQKAQS